MSAEIFPETAVTDRRYSQTRERRSDDDARCFDQNRERDAKRTHKKWYYPRIAIGRIKPLVEEIQTDDRQRERRRVGHETMARHDSERGEAVKKERPNCRRIAKDFADEQKEKRQREGE